MNDLCRHILHSLCQHDHLDPNQTPLLQALITKKGKPCGLFFQVKGPRLLKNYAIWAGDENRILYYNCNGERVAETKLSKRTDHAHWRREAGVSSRMLVYFFS